MVRIVAMAALLAAAFAGCGSDDDHGSTAKTAPGSRGELRARLVGCDAGEAAAQADVEACMTDAIEDAEPALGLDVVPVARRAVASSPRLEGACHMAMHPIGEAAIEHHSVKEALAAVGSIEDSQCDTGFVHGLLVGAGSASDDDALDGIIAACDLEQDPAGRAGCVHGLGHVARRRTDSVRGAVAWCDRIATDRTADCTIGLFHDLQLSAAGSESGGPQPRGADRDFAEHAVACAALNPTAATSCTWRLGMERGADAWPDGVATAPTAAAAATRIRSTCADAAWRRTRPACVSGIVRALRGPGGSIADPAALLQVCDHLPAADADACVHALFDLSPETRSRTTTACATASDPVREACGWWSGHLRAMGLDDVAPPVCDAKLEPIFLRGCRAGARSIRTLGIV